MIKINNRLKHLNNNCEKCFKKIHEISRLWARYRLSLKGRIVIARTFFYDTINRMMRSFVNTGSTLTLRKGSWIHEDILCAPK